MRRAARSWSTTSADTYALQGRCAFMGFAVDGSVPAFRAAGGFVRLEAAGR